MHRARCGMGTPLPRSVRFGVAGVLLVFALATFATPVSAKNTGKNTTEVEVKNDSGVDAIRLRLIVKNTKSDDVEVMFPAGQPFDKADLVQMGSDLRIELRNSTGGVVQDGKLLKFTVTVKKNAPKLRFTTPGSSWVDRNLSLSRAKISASEWKLDPQYVAFNDLTDASFGIQNLQFLPNATEASFDSLDLDAIFGAGFDPGLPHFLLSPLTSSEDLGLLFDTGPDPDDGNFVAAIGQIVDPESGAVVGAFIHGIQTTVPEPSTLLLLCSGLACLGGMAWDPTAAGNCRRIFPRRAGLAGRGWCRGEQHDMSASTRSRP